MKNIQVTGWNPELVILAVVFSNSTDLVVAIPFSTVKNKTVVLKNFVKTLSDVHVQRGNA